MVSNIALLYALYIKTICNGESYLSIPTHIEIFIAGLKTFLTPLKIGGIWHQMCGPLMRSDAKRPYYEGR